MMFRYSCCCEATFRDDPPKAIPVAAEFCALFDECAEALLARSPEGAAEMHLMVMQMGIDPIVFLPQISMEQWETMMEEFYRWVKRYRDRLAHLLVADDPVLAVCGPGKGV